jgi:nucleotide-binding universal stress UspA family protein
MRHTGGDDHMFKNILLASDGSEHALRAAEKTIALINHHPDSKVTVLYVIGSTTSKSDVLESTSREEIEARRKERLSPTEKKLKDAGVAYEPIARDGTGKCES